MNPKHALGAAIFAVAFALGLPTAGRAQPAASPPATTAPATATPARQPSAAQLAQQERMRSCNTEAGIRTLAGDARRSFMSECLAGRMPAAPAAAARQPTPAQAAQQNRMSTCNSDAGTQNLAGDARRTFMTACLSGRAPAASASPAPLVRPAAPAPRG